MSQKVQMHCLMIAQIMRFNKMQTLRQNGLAV